jgi:hypothetical protein
MSPHLLRRRLGNAAARFATAVRDAIIAVAGSAGRLPMICARHVVAGYYRYRRPVALIGVSLAVIFFATWYFLPPAPTPLHRHMIYPSERDFLHRVFPRDRHDTRHADFYYLVSFLFIPAQTALLLIGGFAAYWTLRQGHRFKQYDVEENCVRDYLEVERQLEEADDDKEVGQAIRSYWVLMLYEYYWWRKDLISRELFTNWCEFRVHRFRKNEPYPLRVANAELENYRKGYEYHRTKKTFPSPSRFDDLITFLMDRAAKGVDDLDWKDIEPFRHGRGRII